MMSRNKSDCRQTTEPPFQRISDACRTTGLSMHYLRKGCRDGSVPHVLSGNTFYVNVPALLRKLGATPPEGE